MTKETKLFIIRAKIASEIKTFILKSSTLDTKQLAIKL